MELFETLDTVLSGKMDIFWINKFEKTNLFLILIYMFYQIYNGIASP